MMLNNSELQKLHYLTTGNDKTRPALQCVYLTVLNVPKAGEPFSKLHGKAVAMATNGFVLGLQEIKCPPDLLVSCCIPHDLWKTILSKKYVAINQDDQKVVSVEYDNTTIALKKQTFPDVAGLIESAHKSEENCEMKFYLSQIKKIAMAYDWDVASFHNTAGKAKDPKAPSPVIFDLGSVGCGLIMPLEPVR